MVKITIGEFKEFYESIKVLNEGFSINNQQINFSSTMSYAVSKNLRKLKNDYQSILDTVKKIMKEPNEEFTKIQERYANKDKNGKPIINNFAYDIPEDKIQIVTAKKEKIDEKYKKNIEKKNKFLAKEDEFDIYQVHNKHFPDLPQFIADAIFCMRREK